ncbi:DUF4162 domain-containing protein [Actinotalea sp.]|uniref:ATP-binding protein DrrA1-3 family domain-containing protein n=1 Tax=Actinotalea sp. TaxID=1872145 RepID=UPI002B853631|nr:DUF4162 domain-containing protein [Actinotalea sp.]HRA51885.1 DUF4162 domain-containing protein [Actinotalea sp.]
MPGATVLLHQGETWLVGLTPDADDQALLAAAQGHGAVREFTPVVPTLAEIFREVVT